MANIEKLRVNSEAMPSAITVYKHNHLGQELWHYEGIKLASGATWIQLEAFFNRDDHPTSYMIFRRGDRYIEWFYADRFYNIFEVHDVSDDHLKGWYCNICRPAIITDGAIHCDDLALDLWVTSTGEMLLLDEDEFDALTLSHDERNLALQAVADLRALVEQRQEPFTMIPV